MGGEMEEGACCICAGSAIENESHTNTLYSSTAASHHQRLPLILDHNQPVTPTL